MDYHAKVLATPNIAVVKYWGKRDEKLMLPTNSSLSFTMDEQLKTETEIRFEKGQKEDELVLDGARLEGNEMDGVRKVLHYVRGHYDVEMHAKINSKNHFPTAAGMASSASGYAALAYAINAALQLHLSGKELSIMARLGSGSACRSIYGGFVEWQKGEKKDGSDSFAVQLADENHWPELRNVIAIVDQEKKKVSSRAGMRETVATSELFQERMKTIDKTVRAMKKAVFEKDFPEFAELAMRDSDSMHACMADTQPTIVYLNDISRKIISEVNLLNSKNIVAGYTFDAGPNAHIYTTEKNAPAVQKMLSKFYGVAKTIVCKVGGGPRVFG
ncbi:MAG: diphosphomevalonate decarboxylase [Candidatus Micrarchaeota archaeon]